jgi:hypothetical protein
MAVGTPIEVPIGKLTGGGKRREITRPALNYVAFRQRLSLLIRVKPRA